MRIGMQSWGSEGDIRPFLALGGGLSRAGHDVTYVITELDTRDYTRYAAPLGIRIQTVASPVFADPDEGNAVLQKLVSQPNPFKQGRFIIRQLFEPLVPQMYEAATELCANNDLVIGHFLHHPLRAAAELAGKPEISVSFSPDGIPSADAPPTGLPDLGRLWNRAWWGIALWSLRRAFLPPVNAFREKVGLEPLRHMLDAWYSRRMNLLAVSPALKQRGDDWDPRHRVTGFFNLPSSDQVDSLSDDIEEFLEDGTPPVFIGFGSLTPKHETSTELLGILEAGVSAAGCRAIMQGFREPGRSARGGVLHVGRVPHVSVFPRCAAVVHHAGAGTTQTTVAAGVPSVGVPHVADQFYWSAELHRLGIASKPLMRLKVTADRLARRIREVVSTPSMKQRAEEMRARQAGEDGVATAVALIEESMRTN